jgi:3-oxoacyl-[acyl-carrier protein] reductase
MSKVGNVGQSSYSASKAALNVLTQSLSDEIQKKYKMHNFTINAISPGIIDTRMAHEVPERVRDICLKQIPMNRFGKAEEIAQTVLFIASKGAGYMTGKIVEVDGGWYNG